ncbi:MAG: tetratricopeptide repeat protein [Muribaculaceae bacterium]|nr:tetratricopeptide repeat protein [Muribaculaceae bacterium]
MKRKPIILALLALGAITADAQINSPQSNGYEARAAAMLADGNFQGCIDQCKVAIQLGSARRQQLQWLAAVAAFNGGLPEAKPMLTAYVRQFPNATNILSARLMLATIVFYNGEYGEALKQFNAIDARALQDNEREDLAYRRAYSLMKLGDFEQATPLMQELAGTKRYGDSATFYEAYMAFADGEYQYALDLFEKCDRTKAPGNMADYYVAQILFRQAKYADALNLLMPLMARKDVAPEYLDETERIAGECYYALGDDNRAMVYLNPYIAKHGSDAPLSTKYIVGVERYQTADYDEALELLAPVSALTDEMGQSAAVTMGQSYLAKGNTKAALLMFDKATQLDFNPSLTEMAYYNYAVAQVDGGRLPFGNSVQTLEAFLKRYPKSRYADTVREYLIKGYMATDDYDGALRSLNAMKNADSKNLVEARQQVNFVLGTRALQAGDAKRAISYLTDAQKFSSANASIALQTELWLGDAYYADGEFGKAAAQYRKFLAKAPSSDDNRSIAQYNLAYSLFGARDYGEARKGFRNVVADRRQSSDVKADGYNRIGDTYYYEKQLTEAKQAYRKAYETNAAGGDYSLLQSAMMDGHLGQHSSKLQTLGELIQKYQDSALRPVAMTETALTYVVMGNTPAAITEYKQIASNYGHSAHGRNAILQLAILSDNTGKTDDAISYYRQVISNYPTSAEAALAVEDMKRIYSENGKIEELNSFLESVDGAPQLDATEKNAIAAASLLRKAKTATTNDGRLAAANELLTKYPDAEGAEEALAIAAAAYLENGLADKALTAYGELEQRSTTAAMRHTARMGILRSASEMGDDQRIIEVSANVMADAAAAGADLPEVKFRRANALSNIGNTEAAIALWKELSGSVATVYGVRSAYEIADYHYRNNELTKAADEAEKIIDANPPHAYWLARTFILYSDILRSQGSDFEADEYLKALQSNYPGAETDIFLMIDKRLPK